MRVPWEYEEPACAEVGGDFWFPEQSQSLENNHVVARKICASCTHKTECLEWGLAYEDFGIWGGLSENERRNIRRMRRKSA